MKKEDVRKEVAEAIKNHKQIQFKKKGSEDWNDVKSFLFVNWDLFDYRVKPKEEKKPKVTETKSDKQSEEKTV